MKKLNVKLDSKMYDYLLSIWAGAKTRKLYYENRMTDKERKTLDSCMAESFKILDKNNISFYIQNSIMWHGQNNLDCYFSDTLQELGIEFI